MPFCKSKQISETMVSVWVVTYNQERFISQCLDSILMQKTNYTYEIIIGEDFSTDNTRAICNQYALKYQNITLLPSTTNLGIVKNWERTLNACHGKYIAMCEGDDYWIDPNKLQLQIDFLEGHHEYNISFHKVKLIFEDNIHHDDLFNHLEEREYTTEEIYNTWSILTSSVVFRNIPKKIKFPRSIYFTDIYLDLLLLETGKAFCMDFLGVAYRRHSASLSLSTSLTTIKKLFIQYKYMAKKFPKFKHISIRNRNNWLDGLIYAPYFNGIWKYRLYKMYIEPKLIFTGFFTTTLTSYIFNRKQ